MVDAECSLLPNEAAVDQFVDLFTGMRKPPAPAGTRGCSVRVLFAVVTVVELFGLFFV